MSRILVDTNIISSVAKPAPSEALVAWMAEQIDGDLFICSLTVAEIRRGMTGEARRKEAQGVGALVFRSRGPASAIRRSSAPFDEKAALVWARLMAGGTAKGRPRSPLDMIVAAVAEANDCVVVTENEKHFAGLKIVNRLRAN